MAFGGVINVSSEVVGEVLIQREGVQESGSGQYFGCVCTARTECETDVCGGMRMARSRRWRVWAVVGVMRGRARIGGKSRRVSSCETLVGIAAREREGKGTYQDGAASQQLGVEHGIVPLFSIIVWDDSANFFSEPVLYFGEGREEVHSECEGVGGGVVASEIDDEDIAEDFFDRETLGL